GGEPSEEARRTLPEPLPPRPERRAASSERKRGCLALPSWGVGYSRTMPRAHLLVVDDEPSILTTLQKALSLEGYGVDVAGGVKVAEEKVKKRSYDLCLFDVQLPDGDGLSLLAQLRAAKSEVPVIMMSGHATIDTAVKATR